MKKDMKKELIYGGVRGVNRLTHVIHGVSVIQAGPALGHGSYIDTTTLEQVTKMGNFLPMGVKSRFTHPGLSADGLGRFLGRVKGFYIDGERVRGDLYLSEVAAKSPHGDLREYIESLAESDASSFGMSIVYQPAEPQERERKQFIRLAALLAVDVVDEPAANRDGLFSAALIGTNQLAERAFKEVDTLCLGSRLREWLSAGTLFENLPVEVRELTNGYSIGRICDVASYYLAARGNLMDADVLETVEGEWPGIQLQQQLAVLQAELVERKRLEQVALKRVAELEQAAREERLAALCFGWAGDRNVHLSILRQLDEECLSHYVGLMKGLTEQLDKSVLITNIGTSRPVPASSGDLLENLARARAVEKGLTYEAAYAAILLENPNLYSKGGA